ncbi:MAG TPA: co-chaperone GroES family protein [bacterium]|nr:co-chaperone GroES family protein [bacterium]HPN45122.1 co-chaperone GroES family protein [bacterium]
MKKGKKELIVVGDRLLIVPDLSEDRSNTGLYLPKWAVERESVQAGRIAEVGPGVHLAQPNEVEEEPWKQPAQPQSRQPLQAQVGDYAIFLRKAAVEIKFEGDTYLIVPHAAILLLVREH